MKAAPTTDDRPGLAAGRPDREWREEMRSAWLYDVVARAERDPLRRQLFESLGQAARAQADLWANSAHASGSAPRPTYAPDLRARSVAALVRALGPRACRPALAALKVRGLSLYAARANSAGAGHVMPTSLDDFGARHRAHGGGSLRAAVFGVNDGLVSNTSLILGVAGAAAEPRTLLLSGLAGLLAGAFSMAAGEYVSMRSQRELFEYQIGLERAELAEYPSEEAEELALIHAARGMDQEAARRYARDLMRHPEQALDALAREELGLNPDDLGSPWRAALWSFLAFTAGAAIPLLPFLFARGADAVRGAALLSGLALFGVGALLSLFTGRSAWISGLRMVAVGALAGGATWGIGSWFGVATAG